jgi:hypothetical protein
MVYDADGSGELDKDEFVDVLGVAGLKAGFVYTRSRVCEYRKQGLYIQKTGFVHTENRVCTYRKL